MNKQENKADSQSPESLHDIVHDISKLLNKLESAITSESSVRHIRSNAEVAMDLMTSYNEPTCTGYTVVHKSTLIQAAHSIVSLEYELCTAKNSVEELRQVNKDLHSRIAELCETNERLQDSVIFLTPDSMK